MGDEFAISGWIGLTGNMILARQGSCVSLEWASADGNPYASRCFMIAKESIASVKAGSVLSGAKASNPKGFWNVEVL